MGNSFGSLSVLCQAKKTEISIPNPLISTTDLSTMKTLKRPMMWCIFFVKRTPKTMFPSVRHTNTQIRDGMLKEGKRWFGHNSIICMIYISFSQSQQNILNVHNHHQIIIITDKIKSVVFILPRVLTSSTGAGQQWYFGGGAGYQEYKETKTKSAVLLTSLVSLFCQLTQFVDLQDLLIRRFSLTRTVDSTQTENQHSRLTRFVDSEIFIDQISWFYTNTESTF